MLILKIIWNSCYKNTGPSSSEPCTLPFSQFDISKSIVFSTCWLKCRFRKAPEVGHDQLMVNKWKTLPVFFFPPKLCEVLPNNPAGRPQSVRMSVCPAICIQPQPGTVDLPWRVATSGTFPELLCMFPATWTDFKWEKSQLLFCAPIAEEKLHNHRFHWLEIPAHFLLPASHLVAF